MLFSLVTALICIPINSVQVFPFSLYPFQHLFIEFLMIVILIGVM